MLALLLFPIPAALAQQDGVLQIDDPLHRFLAAQQTAGLLQEAHLAHLPLSAYEARRYLDTLDARRKHLTPAAQAALDGFLGRRPHPNAVRIRKALPFLYEDGQTFFSVSGDDYRFEVNPLAYLTYGRARQTATGEREPWVPVWQNTRGARAAGRIGKHFFFETRLEEVQRRDPRPVQALKTAPRLSNVRRPAPGVYDYQVAAGIIGLRTEHFEVRFGRDRNRWGPGVGSLMLSNYAAGYDQLQLRTTVWRLQLVNLFAALTDLTFAPSTSYPDQVWPKKYLAAHRLEINLPGRVQIGAFESILFATDTSFVQRRRGFDTAYLNPVIFYRAAEADRGSPDNMLLGVDAAWTAVPGLRLYTQFLLDELTVDLIGKRSWRNKWGWMAGVHAVLPAPRLSLRAEYARLRPFIYSHRWPVTAYVNYGDVLGHPAGPSAEDISVFAEYEPVRRLHLTLNAAYTRRGRNTPDANYGGDPLLSYQDRASDSGVGLLFGVRRTDWLFEGRLTYELLPNLYAGGALLASSQNDEITGVDRYVAPVALLQWGLPFQSARH